MKNISLKILKVLIAVDLLLIIGSLSFGNKYWLYNTQIGFISATLVMVASVISYRRMVTTRVANGIVTLDDSKDVIDKLEDPHDLYSEEITETEEEKDVAEVLSEEKAQRKANRRSLGQTLKDTKAALSIYRLAAYGVLILGFMYLNRHGLLHIPSYLLALSLPPMIIVIMLLTQKENHSQD